MKSIITILLGAFFGSILIASGAFSWTIIYQMFHFESFHMYGLLFSAIATGIVSVQLMKWIKPKSIYGNPITFKKRPLVWGKNVVGGLIFGLGWGVTGTCSAPMYIVLGLNWSIGLALLTGAIGGTLLFAIYDQLIFRKNETSTQENKPGFSLSSSR